MRDRAAESDWRIFRELRVVALERFCEQVLAEIERLRADVRKSNHERYLQIYRLIHRRDKELARAFNNPRRSALWVQLVQIRDLGLLREDEYARFSEDLRQSVDRFLRN
jgi:hypothetical protein